MIFEVIFWCKLKKKTYLTIRIFYSSYYTGRKHHPCDTPKANNDGYIRLSNSVHKKGQKLMYFSRHNTFNDVSLIVSFERSLRKQR